MSAAVHTLLESPHLDIRCHDGDFPVDVNVFAKLPKGAEVISASRFGSSAWTVTARLQVRIPDGTQRQYFLKCATDTAGRRLIEGEYVALTELYKAAPNFVPEPHGWGEFSTGNPETYFILMDFIDMESRIPDPMKLCSKLVNLHRSSVSPTGKFGFSVSTCQGRTPQAVTWESSWMIFFTRMLSHVADLDFRTNGYWKDLDILEKRVFSHVIPRLIGVLEADGRKIKPCLIHGDLWEGNTGTSRENGEVYVFDPAPFYAHHEMEVGDWRCHYNKIHNKVYMKTYFRLMKPSEPLAEWDDRNRMYCVYYNIIYSVNHTLKGKAIRQQAYKDMYYLIDKYAPFPVNEGPPRLKPSDLAVTPAGNSDTMAQPSKVNSVEVGLLNTKLRPTKTRQSITTRIKDLLSPRLGYCLLVLGLLCIFVPYFRARAGSLDVTVVLFKPDWGLHRQYVWHIFERIPTMLSIRGTKCMPPDGIM